MDLSALNEVAQRVFLPKKKWDELKDNEYYLVTEIKQVYTRFGKSTVVEIESSFQLFLPARMNKLFNEKPEELENLMEAVKKVKLYIYHFQRGAFEFRIE